MENNESNIFNNPITAFLCVIGLFGAGLALYCLGYRKYPVILAGMSLLFLLVSVTVLYKKSEAKSSKLNIIDKWVRSHSMMTKIILWTIFVLLICMYFIINPYEQIINLFGYYTEDGGMAF